MKNSSTTPAGFEDLRGRAFQEKYAISELIDASPHRAAFVGEQEGRPIVLVRVQPAVLHDAASRARFERRVRASARVRHPAIGGPIDSGETLDGKLWLVFERPDGEPLDRALAGMPAGRLDWAAARPLLLELVRGLAAAHARGVVHGSVSPSCCWVHGVGSEAPGLRLLDWAANTDPASEEANPSYSRTTTLAGDPVYMAPEAAGGVFGDERSDAYLVGLVAWFMLMGRPPFQAVNAFQLVSMHLQTPVPAMRDAGAEVPAAVEAWVRALLAKEPGQRPASMTEIEQGILGLDELGQPRRVGAEELDKPRGRRGRAKAAAARDEAVQRLGASEAEAGQGIGRRLPGQEIVDPRAVVPSPAMGRPAAPVAAFVAPGGVVGSPLPDPEPVFVAPGPSAVAAPAGFVAPGGVGGPPMPKLEPAFVAPSVPSSFPPAATGGASSEDVERTLAFVGTARAAKPVVPAHEEPTSTVMLTASRAELRAGALPEATVMLGQADAAARLPNDATMMLTGAELGGSGADQPGTMVLGGDPRREGIDFTSTMVLGGDPRHEGSDPTATMALAANPSMRAGAPSRTPEQAPTMLLSGGDAAGGPARAGGAGYDGTAVLGFDALGFGQRGPGPAQHGMQAGPASRMAPPVVAPPPQPPVPYGPPPGPPAHYAPPAGPSVPPQPMGPVAQPEARSQVWMWVVILTLVAAVAGVAVGLALGG